MDNENAWKVSREIKQMFDDEPGPAGEFMKCFVTTSLRRRRTQTPTKSMSPHARKGKGHVSDSKMSDSEEDCVLAEIGAGLSSFEEEEDI